MAVEIIKHNPLRSIKSDMYYEPVLIVYKRKMYPVTTWAEAIKICMYSWCFKDDKVDLIRPYVNTKDNQLDIELFSDRYPEGGRRVKFSPEYTVRYFPNGADNCRLLNRLFKLVGRFDIYILRSDQKEIPDDRRKKLITKKKKELTDTYKYKNGSTKHLLAHINGKVLNAKEKFYHRVESEFDKYTLIGDIQIDEKEEVFLKEYMQYALRHLENKNTNIQHEKIFAYGLVYAARKNYEEGRFWPHIGHEFDYPVSISMQRIINAKYRGIMLKHGKPYDDSGSISVQNVCMQTFVCDKCADQLFDYMFNFWRLDLSRSIENLVDDDGNNYFDILIDEIRHNHIKNVVDVMIHTTMALKANPRGSRNRFRHILRMIDNSYWNNTDYSGSTNRITKLFNEWKNNKDGAFQKELAKDAESRRRGRGERLLSRPYISYDPRSDTFRIVLPKQILRRCTENEQPVWHLGNKYYTYDTEPKLLIGQSAYFTDECFVELEKKELFVETEIWLESEERRYCKRKIKASDVRFFNNRNVSSDVYDDYISIDTSYAFVKKGQTLEYVSSDFDEIDRSDKWFDHYMFQPSFGDVLILPDRSAISVGRILREGIIGSSRQSGVTAIYNDQEYEITADRERIFFKALKNQLRGTSIRIVKGDRQIYFGKVTDKKIIEFRLYEEAEDVMGYLVDMHDYVKEDGIYDLQLSVPGDQVKSYKVCYIRKFSYRFKDAPYLFKDTGVLEVPKHLTFADMKDWETDGSYRTFEFGFDETLRDGERYVNNRKLELDYLISGKHLTLRFDLPVLYWKYKPSDEWQFRQPDDTFASKMPKNIYISGDIDLENAKLLLTGDKGHFECEVTTNHNVEKDLWYFRTIDLMEYLNREMTIRQLRFCMDGITKPMLNVVCKSIVLNKNITGDFTKNIIYGNFQILGNSEYMVTIRYGGEVLEEDIPLKDGHFRYEGAFSAGLYDIALYEMEEDDSGFDAVSYEVDHFPLYLRDVAGLSDTDLYIRSVQDREGRFQPIKLFSNYVILNLKRLNYIRDVKDQMDIPSYLYQSDDPDVMRKFSYYKGRLVQSWEKRYFVAEVLIIFDNPENMGEALIYELVDDDASPLLLNMKGGRLISNKSFSSSKLYKALGREIMILDDDLYRITVEVREK